MPEAGRPSRPGGRSGAIAHAPEVIMLLAEPRSTPPPTRSTMSNVIEEPTCSACSALPRLAVHPGADGRSGVCHRTCLKPGSAPTPSLFARPALIGDANGSCAIPPVGSRLPPTTRPPGNLASWLRCPRCRGPGNLGWRFLVESGDPRSVVVRRVRSISDAGMGRTSAVGLFGRHMGEAVPDSGRA